jgi:hypothetical protein
MPQLLTALERQEAARDQALARRRVTTLRGALAQPDLSPTVRQQATVKLDDDERECAMLGSLLAENGRSGWTMGRFASEQDSPEARPYQVVVR